MGKKSKKNAGGGAKTKSKSVTSAVRSSDDAGEVLNRDGTGGGILTSTSSGKKQKCIRCLASLKDLAKAHQCPGCSLLFCWRCEKKNFGGCPNGEQCVHPVMKCRNCRGGATMQRELVAAGVLAPNQKMTIEDLWTPNIRKAYEEMIKSRVDLSDDSWPGAVCGALDCSTYGNKSVEEMITLMECIHCALEPSPSKLLSCGRCQKIRCRACSVLSDPAFNTACDQLNGLIGTSFDLLSNPSVVMACWSTYINAGGSDQINKCITCKRRVCVSCMDFTEQSHSVRTMLEYGNGIDPHYSDGFQCSTCYWASKPCTNPNCPKEVGVPTKRCGGCHLDRYCSVECQTIMHLEHVEKCQKIQEKRATAGKGVPTEK